MSTATILFLIDIQNGFLKPNLTREEGGSLYVEGAEYLGKTAADLIKLLSNATIILSQDYHPADHISFVDNHKGGELYQSLGLKRARSGGYVPAHPGDPVDYYQTLWGRHCVRGTESALFDKHLMNEIPEPLRSVIENHEAILPVVDRRGNSFHVVRKGTRRDLDSYGIVTENDNVTTTGAEKLFVQLADKLVAMNFDEAAIFIGGVATNYCVEFSNADIHKYLVPALQNQGIDSTVTFLRDASAGVPARTFDGLWPDLFYAPQRMAQTGTRLGSTVEVLQAQRPEFSLGHQGYTFSSLNGP